ncbi:hypothetical protein KSP40_PGU002675 [Platanthera guangdongensis]|uniref:Uncharacterized protein n=1 Tax=Platanthera guangdongensis TaxID=2320717 RepID=A0ABR2LTN6_9ASPA
MAASLLQLGLLRCPKRTSSFWRKSHIRLSEGRLYRRIALASQSSSPSETSAETAESCVNLGLSLFSKGRVSSLISSKFPFLSIFHRRFTVVAQASRLPGEPSTVSAAVVTPGHELVPPNKNQVPLTQLIKCWLKLTRRHIECSLELARLKGARWKARRARAGTSETRESSLDLLAGTCRRANWSLRNSWDQLRARTSAILGCCELERGMPDWQQIVKELPPLEAFLSKLER